MEFVDSRGLFGCRIPKNFLRAERPKDKRGTVFVAGDYSKAEVLSVQVVNAFDLLKDAGEKGGPYVRVDRHGGKCSTMQMSKAAWWVCVAGITLNDTPTTCHLPIAVRFPAARLLIL